jgi:Rho GDP-dissociation inhibitor
MASQADDDLTASKTEGYKAGEKKTVEEYAKLGPSQSSSLRIDIRLGKPVFRLGDRSNRRLS